MTKNNKPTTMSSLHMPTLKSQDALSFCDENTKICDIVVPVGKKIVAIQPTIPSCTVTNASFETGTFQATCSVDQLQGIVVHDSQPAPFTPTPSPFTPGP